MPSLGQAVTQHDSTRDSVTPTRWIAAKVNPGSASGMAFVVPAGRPSMARPITTIRETSLAVIAGKHVRTIPPLAGS